MTASPAPDQTGDPQAVVDHLDPQRMGHAHRMLVRKAIAEFAHEQLVVPRRHSGHWYVLGGDDPRVEYRFQADVLPLDHWWVVPASITRLVASEETELDARQLVLDVRDRLGLGDDVLPVYLEEIASTLSGAAYKLADGRPTSAELVDAAFQTIEAAMTEGHPCFVANNGRLGFDADDYRRFAPEVGAPFRVVWLAVRSDRTTFASVSSLDYDTLLASELDAATRGDFDRTLTDLGLDPAGYRLMPAHPWQWFDKLAVTFAPEVARRDIVCLGYGPDDYLAQQSVRTFFNASAPHKRYVKTALSILNMGFMRGLSPGYMATNPPINDWVAGLVAGDPVLQESGFSILREVAAIGYHHELYEAVGAGTPYAKMLSALWRESPVPGLVDGERLATMASLLHVDATGRPLVAELVEASPLPPRAWLRRYLDAYLVPLLHSFYAHDLVFMPHGENLILVLRDHVVTRVIMKDVGEEIAVLDPGAALPPGVERVRADVPPELHVLSIVTDVFDCVLRFLSGLLDEAGLVSAADFWGVVADCVGDYQAQHPELAERFAAHDLFADDFARSCLNRLQLRDNTQMVDLTDPASALALAGPLANPLAEHRERVGARASVTA